MSDSTRAIVVTPQYVEAVLAVQGYTVASAAAQLIAPTLTTQLKAATPTYDRLPFEAEPAGFNARLTSGAA